MEMIKMHLPRISIAIIYIYDMSDRHAVTTLAIK